MSRFSNVIVYAAMPASSLDDKIGTGWEGKQYHLKIQSGLPGLGELVISKADPPG